MKSYKEERKKKNGKKLMHENLVNVHFSYIRQNECELGIFVSNEKLSNCVPLNVFTKL